MSVLMVSDIMTKNPVAVTMDSKVSDVKAIFEKTGFHHLLVVEDHQLVGIISDRDLLRSISPMAGTKAETTRDAATLNKRAHQIMSRKLVTLSSHAKIIDAVEMFNGRRISCIPIVDDRHKPLGILSWRDVMRALRPKSSAAS